MELPFAVEEEKALYRSSPAFDTDNDDVYSLEAATASYDGSFLCHDSPHKLTATSAPLRSMYPQQSAIHQSGDDTTSEGFSDMLAQFGVGINNNATSYMSSPAMNMNKSRRGSYESDKSDTYQGIPKENAEETIDFTYVNVCETDEDEVDIMLSGQEHFGRNEPLSQAYDGNDSLIVTNFGRQRGEILALLLSGSLTKSDGVNEQTDSLMTLLEQANQATAQASDSKKDGNLQAALDAHSAAAKCFRDAANLLKDSNDPMANSLLLLSQTQARFALALKRVIKLPPNDLFPFKQSNQNSSQDRLRATLRGALDNRTEADISESAFLGRANKGDLTNIIPANPSAGLMQTASPLQVENRLDSKNAVDEMMQLERELRDMDMALEMGNSIASLDARSLHSNTRVKASNSIAVGGSFMVVPPESGSFMSSSSAINSSLRNNNVAQTSMGTAGVRARANRVQNLVGGSRPTAGAVATATPVAAMILPAPTPTTTSRNHSLESSWWGNSSVASQVLASSVSSLASLVPEGHGSNHANNDNGSQQQPTNTKQLMRLMDALKTLGDENAALLRQVEGAEAARLEAKAAKEQMKNFKLDYGKRFATLKEALEKFRKGYPDSAGTEINPVTSSAFLRSASTTDQLQRQEQLIKKLTADLKKEKEESKKKDVALRKYESFYREVKARSAQKAAQRQQQTQQRQQQSKQLTSSSARPYVR